MKLIIGLGNPGRLYQKNRHNLGFRVIDEIIKKEGLTGKKCRRTSSEKILTCWGNNKIILTKPLTFMNNSGESVRKLASFYKVKPTDIWVIYDDIDLPLGKIRLKRKGSAGGHKGVASIINHLKSGDFNRLKIGIGSNREKGIKAEKYVLADFSRREETIIQEAINIAIEILAREIKQKKLVPH